MQASGGLSTDFVRVARPAAVIWRLSDRAMAGPGSRHVANAAFRTNDFHVEENR
jgi:hypothetical protein